MSTWDDKPNDPKHAEDWRESIIEECARAIEDYFDHIGFAEGAGAHIRALKMRRTAIIEECARVAEQTWVIQEGPATEVATAIRKLGDKKRD